MSDKSDYIHKEHPKKFPKDDFWAQVKRTVNGKPVSQENINMIVNQINSHLFLSKNDHLLDLGCGNGALSSNFFSKIKKYSGVDFSPYLLEIAREFFASDITTYYEDDIVDFVCQYDKPSEIDKLLVYGCMSYLSRKQLEVLIKTLSERYTKLKTCFIGNVPDLNKSEYFFSRRKIVDYSLDDEKTEIGIWWHPEDLQEMAKRYNFSSYIARMPSSFYASDYRFDLVLKKNIKL